MNCAASKALLTLYVLKDLDEATEATVRTHLDTCPDCRAALQEIDTTLGLLRDALAAPTTAAAQLATAQRSRVLDQRPSRAPVVVSGLNWFTQHHRVLAAAAAVVVILGVIGLVMPAKHLAQNRAYRVQVMATEEMVDTLGDLERPAPQRASAPVTRYGFKAKKPGFFRRLRSRRSAELVPTPLPEPAALGVDSADALLDEAREIGVDSVSVPDVSFSGIEPPEEIALESAEFEEVAMVKSPVIMRGFLGNRSAGRRAAALAHYGGRATAAKSDRGEMDGTALGVEMDLAAAPTVGASVDYFAHSDLGTLRSDTDVDGDPSAEDKDVRRYEKGKKSVMRDQSAAAVGKSMALAEKAVWKSGPTALKAQLEAEGLAANGSVERLEEAAKDKEEQGLRQAADMFAAIEVRAKREDEPLSASSSAEEEQRRRFTAHGVNPFVVSRRQPFSTFGIDVDTASYTLTRSMMTQGTLPPAEAVRTEEFVNAFDYDYVAPSHRTFRIYTELAPSPFGRGLQMLKIGVKGRRLGREEQRPAVLTFLVDTSGSMNAPERIGLVRKSLRLLVENLGPNDQVAVVQYDSHARLLLEHTPASEKARILQAIDRMQCSGSTNLEEGMNVAYRLAAGSFIGGAENRVLLLSDGVANLGNIAAEDILKKVATYRKQGIFCSVFGLGSGNYDDTMLETLANKGDGVYTFLDSEAQAQRVFVDDLAATLNTIASDVKIQVEFNPNIVKQYRQLGYENRRLKKEDFRNDAVDAGEVGSGQSVTALYELELLPQLLAKTRIDLPPRKLATVRVRYRRIDTGRVEEIERAVWPHECVPVLDKAGRHFRLAAAVAEFAEILRGSPHAKGSSYEDVADVLRPIALELHLDERVQELLQMVTAAESTPRGQ